MGLYLGVTLKIFVDYRGEGINLLRLNFFFLEVMGIFALRYQLHRIPRRFPSIENANGGVLTKG